MLPFFLDFKRLNNGFKIILKLPDTILFDLRLDFIQSPLFFA
jgi:hypothetical protein